MNFENSTFLPSNVRVWISAQVLISVEQFLLILKLSYLLVFALKKNSIAVPVLSRFPVRTRINEIFSSGNIEKSVPADTFEIL